MEQPASTQPIDAPPPTPPRPSSSSGSKCSAAGASSSLLSKIPFMRSHADLRRDADESLQGGPGRPGPMPDHNHPQQQQQQKTRRRRGSLRKVALLGRGAQRERKEAKAAAAAALSLESSSNSSSRPATPLPPPVSYSPTSEPRREHALAVHGATHDDSAGAADSTSRASRAQPVRLQPLVVPSRDVPDSEPSPSRYSTTDDEGGVHMGRAPTPLPLPLRPSLDLPSSGSEGSSSMGAGPPALLARSLSGAGLGLGLGGGGGSVLRRRSGAGKSPLGLAAPLAAGAEADWDYSQTEWWGWVLLGVTWFVFVTGMGSCLGVWSWVWDVGTTPYAPPELEDDPTLPIVGYYPALIILTCVMAWVWVVAAWVGMKYFRHAKISGD